MNGYTGVDIRVMFKLVFEFKFSSSDLNSAIKIISEPNGEKLQVNGKLKSRVSAKRRIVSEDFYDVPGSSKILLSVRGLETVDLVKRLFHGNAQN